MNEAKLQDFMGKLVNDMGGAAMLANVILGDELGLYRAMADGEPTTADELARKTGCNARLVREWLSAQAAAGYVEHSEQMFRLPEEQAMALAQEDSPVYVAGGASVLASFFLDKDKVVRAMRGDGGLSWGDHHPCLFTGTERFFRPGYRAHLVSEWLPALEGVVPEADARGQGRRRRLRARGLDGDHGAGVPGIVFRRLRLPSDVDRDGAPPGGGCRRRRPRCVCRRKCQGLRRTRLRPHLFLRLPARHG